MTDFSLDLNEDQLQIQKWVHDFAEDVVRPAAHEWDEREETPWPIIEEAAKIGLYSFDFFANAFADPTGPDACRSSWRSCSGVTPASACRSSARRSAWPASWPTARPSRSCEWVPAVLRHARQDPARRLRRVSEPDAGSDCRSLRTRAVYDEAKDEWVLNGTKTWITNGGIADVHVRRRLRRPRARLPGPGRLRRPARARRASARAQKFKKHGIRASHTAEVVLDDVPRAGLAACSAARRSSTSAWPGPARARARRPGRHGHLRGHPPGGRRPGRRHRPGRLRVRARLRQGAQAVRPGDHREPGDRLQAGRHEDRASTPPGCWSGGPPGWASTGKRFENGEGSMSKL